MGHYKKVKYVVEVKTLMLQNGRFVSVWQQTGCYDKLTQFPNDAKKLRDDYNASLLPGGVNAHLSQSKSGIPHASDCRVRNQFNGTIPFSYTAPMFEVV